MTIKGLIDEDFVQYKKPSMTIMFRKCSFKCEKECGMQVCQNGALANSKDISISIKEIKDRYVNNNISKSIVCSGLEPFDTYDDLKMFIQYLREFTKDDIVIFTGYKKDEIEDKITELKRFKNIIVKFGRFIPNQSKHFDKVLGVELASDNQYAERIS